MNEYRDKSSQLTTMQTQDNREKSQTSRLTDEETSLYSEFEQIKIKIQELEKQKDPKREILEKLREKEQDLISTSGSSIGEVQEIDDKLKRLDVFCNLKTGLGWKQKPFAPKMFFQRGTQVPKRRWHQDRQAEHRRNPRLFENTAEPCDFAVQIYQPKLMRKVTGKAIGQLSIIPAGLGEKHCEKEQGKTGYNDGDM
mgnify:CR=1 FL=1